MSHFILPILVGSLLENHQGDNLIKPRVALYLLAQMFIIFTHPALINSVVISLFCPHPPVLSYQLITSPPQYPVKDHDALASVLYPKYFPSNHRRRENASNKIENCESLGKKGRRRNSTMRWNEIKQRSQKVDFMRPKNVSKKQISQAQSMQTRDIPDDENILKPRSKVPEMKEVSTPLASCPNYNEKAANNPYREALLAGLAHQDERIVFFVMAVIIAAIKNESIDSALLHEAEMLPQVFSRKFQLLEALTTASDNDALETEGDILINNKTDRSVKRKNDSVNCKKIQALNKEEEQPLHHVIRDAIGEEEGPSCPVLQASSQTLETSIELQQLQVSSQGNSILNDNELCEDQLTTQTIQNRSINCLDIRMNSPASRLLEYPTMMVTLLLEIIQRPNPYRTVTLQLMIKLLGELVYDGKSQFPCLNQSHLDVIETGYRRAAKGLARFNRGALAPLIVDMFEDEWHCLEGKIKWKSIISNSINLLPISENAISGLPMGYRHPDRKSVV